MIRPAVLVLAAAASAACRSGDAGVVRLPPDQTAEKRDQPPVALNADSPIAYPPALFTQGIDGTVLLRLFVDPEGTLVSDSTKVQESSGYPALDSAAVAGAAHLRFAPALREGEPVAAAFIQPIEFRSSGAQQ